MSGTIYNRELSWLQFNERVLQEANDKSVPLMQRLRFLGIYSNNQDEFFKVRVANLIRFAAMRGNKKPVVMTGGYTPTQLLPMLYEKVGKSQKRFRETYTQILKEMESHGVYVVNETELSKKQYDFVENYYESVISVSLIPLLIRRKVEIPFLSDGRVYLAIKMTRGTTNRFAILKMPVSSSSPRFVVLPTEKEGRTDVIFIDDIVRLFLDRIFFMFNYDSISAHTFKLIRDAELLVDDDVSKSFAEKMTHGITLREKGRPIRLIYDSKMPVDALHTIANKLGIKSLDQLEPSGRYHLMRDLAKFPKVLPHLENKSIEPIKHQTIDTFSSILKVIRLRDILLCYPYHTFRHFIDMLREAAVDPRVESIYITLYRTAENSKVINALINAAKNGKNVTVLVELKARFDEEHNISTTELLQKNGVKVINSDEELKVHSKLVLIERREGAAGLRGYVYVGTGNFNENTAAIYGDFGLFTANPTIAADARKVFNYLQVPHKYPQPKILMVSPYYLRQEVENIIESEIENAKKGKKAYIYAKFNSLTDEKMIKLLYRASSAGVRIKLIVRGACCLIPQVKGLSENITIRSIVDKYLEHARMIIQCNNGKPRSYIMSADLMTRNLDRRVEVGVEILDKKIHQKLEEFFAIQWRDNVKSRIIAEPFDNSYVKAKDGDSEHRSQVELYELFND